jgi:Nucleotidyltransferase domain
MALKQLRSGDRGTILTIAYRHGVTNVKVFGSFGRDEARPDSDLDLLIEVGTDTAPFSPVVLSPIWRMRWGAEWTSWRRRVYIAFFETEFGQRQSLFE